MRVGVAMATLVQLAGCGLLACAALLACGKTEGPLLRGRDGSVPVDDGGMAGLDASTAANTDAAAAPVMPAFPANTTWQYQLVGTVDPEIDAQLFVVDLFNAPQSVIDRLHAQGKQAVAYLSAGTLESYRNDASRFPDAAIGNTFEPYPDENWLDVRNEGMRALMAARLDLARSKGFDGLVPTNMTAYLHDSGFDLTAADQADYTAWLSREARARGLHVAMSGDYGQLATLAVHFDWAVDFGCIGRANCDRLAPFREAGKPVLDVETSGEIATICQRAASYGINVILKRPDFGAYRLGCP
jgi:hypothetical protein